MPMAICFVGASVIWKFVYDYRGDGEQQIGLLNAIVHLLRPARRRRGSPLPFWNSVFLMVHPDLDPDRLRHGDPLGGAARRPRGDPRGGRASTAPTASSIFFDIMIPQIWGTIVVVWTTITIVVLKVFDIIFDHDQRPVGHRGAGQPHVQVDVP